MCLFSVQSLVRCTFRSRRRRVFRTPTTNTVIRSNNVDGRTSSPSRAKQASPRPRLRHASTQFFQAYLQQHNPFAPHCQYDFNLGGPSGSTFLTFNTTVPIVSTFITS